MPVLGLGLFLAFLTQVSPAPTPTALSVGVSLEARSLDLDLDEVQLTASSDSLEGIILPQRRDGDTVYFELSADRSWSITCRGEAFWCPSIPITAHSAELIALRHQLPVARRVSLRAKLEASRGELPEQIHLQGWETKPSHAEPVEIKLSANVENGYVNLDLPDFPLDLRVAAAGFAPLYAWGLQPSSRPKMTDGLRALGTWTLRPGSSLCGFVTDGVSGDPVARAEIQLRLPPHRPGTPSQTARRLGRMTWQTKSNGRGFFQIVGPPAGVYQLEVTPVDPERLPRVLPTIELADQSETCVDALEVHPAVPLRVLLNVPSATADHPWQVRLSADSADGHVTPEGPQTPNLEGSVRYRVAPGDYQLTVFSSDPLIRALSRKITVQSEQTLPVRLDMLPVEGQILLGETPLIAKVELNAGDGSFVRLESDTEGQFRGWTRRPQGGLAVRIQAAFPAVSRYVLLDEVDIEDGTLRLDLEFPDRRVSGIVQDETGRPVRSATVTAQPESSSLSVSTQSGVDGRFELVGLEDTPMVVKASARDIGISEPVHVEPWGDDISPDISLILQRGQKLVGRVVNDFGEPVPAARVQLLTVGARPSSVQDTTNISGHFEVYVPETETRAAVQVFSPQLIWSGCLPLPSAGQPIEIRMPSTFGGSVLVPNSSSTRPFSQTVLVNSDGGYFSLSQLVNFGQTRQVEGGFLATSIAPGGYAVLTSSKGIPGLASRACDRTLPVESWQFLSEGQELRFDSVAE